MKTLIQDSAWWTKRVLWGMMFLILASGIRADEVDKVPTSVLITVSLPPQAWLVEQIAGDLAEVQSLLQPGQEPHTYDPTPQQVIGLGHSALYFQVGTLPFEERLSGKIRTSLPNLSIINTSEGMKLRSVSHEGDHADHDGHTCAGGIDPHVWLGPREIEHIASVMCGALVRAIPEHEAELTGNLADFIGRLQEAHHRIEQQLAPYSGRSVFVFHPAFGYFFDTYGLHQVAIEVNGKSPTPRQIQHLIEQARSSRTRVLFAQPGFDRKSAAIIARSINGQVVYIEPLEYDLIANLETMAKKLQEALSDLHE